MKKRIRVLKEGSYKISQLQGPVIYWMSRDQRAEDHWGLVYAQLEAISRNTFLVVVFCYVPNYLQASQRHYCFMMKGLKETADQLEEKGIPFHLIRQSPIEALPEMAKQWRASLIVTDFNPLRIKMQWDESLKKKLTCDFHQVDSHNIVPCWESSDKQEYAAYTFRPRIMRKLSQYLTEIPEIKPQKIENIWFQNHDWPPELAADSFNHNLKDRIIESGTGAGWRKLNQFIKEKLNNYADLHNDPLKHYCSELSPYLHFGQISAQRVALEVIKKRPADKNRETYLEELIVRRELSDNFCFYQKNYDQPKAFPAWASRTLTIHESDYREYLYELEELETAATHDSLWNAAQLEMKLSGSLHGYLRMYWAKKILEWTPTAAIAQQYAITLNDRYLLDGRDPNGYTGIAWSIGGVHDRAWQERLLFGKVRYMNLKGCRRKFDVDGYIANINFLMNQSYSHDNMNESLR